MPQHCGLDKFYQASYPQVHVRSSASSGGGRIPHTSIPSAYSAESAQFREGVAAHALPFLRYVEFTLLGYNVNDHDQYPAISAFLRDRRTINTRALRAEMRAGQGDGHLPKDVAAALVPRRVTALSLQAEPSTDAIPFVSQMCPGLPPNLSFMGLSQLKAEDVVAVVEAGFPTVRVDDY
ncbi:uncharacterized protein C8Q71DRAFT_859583 [Rhodofomes roseus]|uniref:Uncharacterized protein n=1 Tax=Rhodofomes roseus TaxID=34475 RepID=A0ABQ8KB57_9APHY|nr:uncharacterized protein C8Q71DRAFT_859583 [Rhodofomes roseus]KAH9834613.1 hypothetical protein C8Q71DRAFT_859583 [Rhodofomes roseus]